MWGRLGDLVKPDASGELRFRNTLIRDAAYEGLPYRRRRVLHGRVGEAIEAAAADGSLDEEIPSLALHYHEAQRWDKAWRFCREAGDRAMSIYANVDATRFYARALLAARRLRSVTAEEMAALYERSAEAHFRLGEFAAADKGFEAARRLLGRDPIRTAPLIVRQAATAIRTGKLRRAAARAEAGLRRLEDHRGADASASRARLMVPLAAARTHQNKYADGIRLGQVRRSRRPSAGRRATRWPRPTRSSTSPSGRVAISLGRPTASALSRSTTSWATCGTRPWSSTTWAPSPTTARAGRSRRPSTAAVSRSPIGSATAASAR